MTNSIKKPLKRTILKYTFNTGLFLFLFLTALLASAQNQVIDKIIAKVNNKVILKSELESQYGQYLAQAKATPSFDLKCQVFDQMLQEKLLLNQAITDSIKITEDQVESTINQRLRYYTSMFGSEEKLENYFNKSIVEIKDELREDVKDQLLIQKMHEQVTQGVSITPSEVKAYYKSMPDDSIPDINAKVELGQIVKYPSVNPELDEFTYNELLEIRERIINGENFCVMAQSYSQDPGSKNNCGELGFTRREQLVPEFSEVAFNLEPDEISMPVRTEFGYHILELIERRGERINVRHILIKPPVTKGDLKIAEAYLDSIRQLIVDDKMTFAEAALEFSEDKATKNNSGTMVNNQTGDSFFDMEELDFSLYTHVKDLQQGDISRPLLFSTPEGERAYRLLSLKTKTQPHTANLKDDYNLFKTAALNEKKDKAYQEWLESKIRKSYVYISDEYKDCDILKKWLINPTALKQ